MNLNTLTTYFTGHLNYPSDFSKLRIKFDFYARLVHELKPICQTANRAFLSNLIFISIEMKLE